MGWREGGREGRDRETRREKESEGREGERERERERDSERERESQLTFGFETAHIGFEGTASILDSWKNDDGTQWSM